MEPTADGGYAFCGWSDSSGAGGFDYLVVRLDGSGAIAWQRTYGGPGDDFARDVCCTLNGGYVVCGSTASFGAGGTDAWVLKLDGEGHVEWERTCGGTADDSANFLEPTADGGFVVCGSTSSFGAGQRDVWLLKLTSTGDIEWQLACGGGGNDRVEGLAVTPDGDYVICGLVTPAIWLLQVDRYGNTLWKNKYEAADGSSMRTWQLCSRGGDGGVVVGALSSTGENRGFFLEVGAGGEVEQSIRLDRPETTGDILLSASRIRNGGYVLCGLAELGPISEFGKSRGWLVELDATWEVEWSRSYDVAGDQVGLEMLAIEQLGTGGLLVIGHTISCRDPRCGDESSSWIYCTESALACELSADGQVGASCPDAGFVAEADTPEVCEVDLEVTSSDISVVPTSAEVDESTAQVRTATLVRTSLCGSELASGDLNGDATVDILDLRLCLELAMGSVQGTAEQRAAADIDHDGDVDRDDAVILAEFALGLRTSLP